MPSDLGLTTFLLSKFCVECQELVGKYFIFGMKKHLLQGAFVILQLYLIKESAGADHFLHSLNYIFMWRCQA